MSRKTTAKPAINHTREGGFCCWLECSEEGIYPAPKSPEHTQERYYFCLNHVREYNKSWNYFSRMDSEQIDHFHRESIVGHRPTWRFGVSNMAHNIDEIERQVFGHFHGHYTRHSRSFEEKSEMMRLPKQTRDALQVLGLSYPVTIPEIKKRYKELAKAHHPDVTHGASEEKIKRINQAYNYLKNLDIFLGD